MRFITPHGHLRRNGPQVSRNAEPAQGFQHQIGDVEFPPALSLAAASRRIMVIVVPTLAECHQRQPKVVAAFVWSIEAARAPQMSQRIDRESAVVQNHCGNHVAPQKRRPSADQGERSAKHHRRDPVVPVQPADLREPEKLTHRTRIVFVEVVGKNPTHMRPPEAAAARRVDISLPIRLPMMQAMMRRPPQDALLRRSSAPGRPLRTGQPGPAYSSGARNNGDNPPSRQTFGWSKSP